MTLLLEGRPFVGIDPLEEWCFSQITHQGLRGGAWEIAEGSVLVLAFTKEESSGQKRQARHKVVQILGDHHTRLGPLGSVTASVW